MQGWSRSGKPGVPRGTSHLQCGSSPPVTPRPTGRGDPGTPQPLTGGALPLRTPQPGRTLRKHPRRERPAEVTAARPSSRLVLYEEGRVPDLDEVPHAREHDLAVELGVLAELLRDQDPARAVDRAGRRSGDREAHQRLAVGIEGSGVDDALLVVGPVRVRVEAEALFALGDHRRPRAVDLEIHPVLRW